MALSSYIRMSSSSSPASAEMFLPAPPARLHHSGVHSHSVCGCVCVYVIAVYSLFYASVRSQCSLVCEIVCLGRLTFFLLFSIFFFVRRKSHILSSLAPILHITLNMCTIIRWNTEREFVACGTPEGSSSVQSERRHWCWSWFLSHTSTRPMRKDRNNLRNEDNSSIGVGWLAKGEEEKKKNMNGQNCMR